MYRNLRGVGQLCRHWDGQASRWPHQIRTFRDAAVRRQHVENKYRLNKYSHVAAGTEYPHLPLSDVFKTFTCCLKCCVI